MKHVIKTLCLMLCVGTLLTACTGKDDDSEGKSVITVKSSNESMGNAYGSGSYDNGSTVRIWGTPEMGYEFANWSDGSTENPRVITVNGDATYTVNFRAVGGGDNPGGGGDNPGGGDEPGPFTASFTVGDYSASGIALISYGGDGNLFDLQILTGEGGDSDPLFGVWILPQAGTQGYAQQASCYYLENGNDMVTTSNGQEFPHYQTINGCNYSINVTAFDLTTQQVSLTASGEMFDIKRAENGEGAHKVNFSVSIDGYWQYPSSGK